MNAIDTNVLIYSLDSNDIEKQATATAFLSALNRSEIPTIIPWQIASELLNYLRRAQRKNVIAASDVMTTIRNFTSSFPLVVPGPETIDHYERLFDQYSLSHWDAMLLAACRDAGVTTLYSEDLAAGTDYGGVVVVNPFARPVA
jgi:predicted nucleic acid-binding protein